VQYETVDFAHLQCAISLFLKSMILHIVNLTLFFSKASNRTEFKNLEQAYDRTKDLLQYVNQAAKKSQNERKVQEMQMKLERRGLESQPAMHEFKVLISSTIPVLEFILND